MGLLDRWGKRSRQEGCGIEPALTGWFSTWMARERRLANVLCPRPQTGRLPRDACAHSARPATPGASVEKSSAGAPLFHRPTAESRLGSFGNPGNGHYREDLRRAVAAIHSYLAAYQFPQECALLRLDGQYGTGAVLADLAGLCYVMRGKDYQLLDRAEVQARLHLPADGSFARPESELVRTLYDCPDVPVGSTGQRCRVIVAIHPSGKTKSRVGVERGGVVYELFLTKLPRASVHRLRCGGPLPASGSL
jgi:hypothetical protein